MSEAPKPASGYGGTGNASHFSLKNAQWELM
jgi:hypothetical protein